MKLIPSRMVGGEMSLSAAIAVAASLSLGMLAYAGGSPQVCVSESGTVCQIYECDTNYIIFRFVCQNPGERARCNVTYNSDGTWSASPSCESVSEG